MKYIHVQCMYVKTDTCTHTYAPVCIPSSFDVEGAFDEVAGLEGVASQNMIIGN